MCVVRACAARPERRARRAAVVLTTAALLLSGGTAGAQDTGSDAAAGERLYAEYLAEIGRPDPHFVAVSNHFRHTEDCTRSGCVIMGPTQDRAACEDWARAWNQFDPYDHARCVEADPIAPLR